MNEDVREVIDERYDEGHDIEDEDPCDRSQDCTKVLALGDDALDVDSHALHTLVAWTYIKNTINYTGEGLVNLCRLN